MAQFFDLPPEVRYMIYDSCFEGAEVMLIGVKETVEMCTDDESVESAEDGANIEDVGHDNQMNNAADDDEVSIEPCGERNFLRTSKKSYQDAIGPYYRRALVWIVGLGVGHVATIAKLPNLCRHARNLHLKNVDVDLIIALGGMMEPTNLDVTLKRVSCQLSEEIRDVLPENEDDVKYGLALDFVHHQPEFALLQKMLWGRTKIDFSLVTFYGSWCIHISRRGDDDSCDKSNWDYKVEAPHEEAVIRLLTSKTYS